MPSKYIKRLLILGGLVILGIIFSQSYWLMKTWALKDQDFDQSVKIALRNTAERISEFNNTELPKSDLIKRRSSNIYAVNINSAIDAQILEDYLIQHFEKIPLDTDFEYAVFDCYSDEMVYGNYCKMGD